MSEEFLIRPDVVYLNHGSFGACPRSVFKVYQDWQTRLESQPTHFLQRELPDRLDAARVELGQFVGAGASDIVFVPNPTFAVNEIVRSLDLGPDHEVLTTDHEYGACVNAWRFMSEKKHFQLCQQPLTMPPHSPDAILREIWSGVTPRTRVIFISHITSPTAITLPVQAICGRALESGIITVVDGAHAPGQIDLDLCTLGADFYVAACHKWLCAPKGASFLYAHARVQHQIQPLVVGWGWGADRRWRRGSAFRDCHEWLGHTIPQPT